MTRHQTPSREKRGRKKFRAVRAMRQSAERYREDVLTRLSLRATPIARPSQR